MSLDLLSRGETHATLLTSRLNQIRLIPSRDEVAYQQNLDGQFNESYNLADTQNLKNKDIPEFGSKGTILLDKHAQGTDPGPNAKPNSNPVP